ncbi:MAG: GPP34 family phosphoprotein [Acidobacteriota bacterium]|nr:GPP34 family phosphoprotein [Acidobacteriota bacterium]
MGQRTLFLQEEIMLLALRDEEGTTIMGSMFPYAAAGGILTELALAGKISFEQRRHKAYVVPVDNTSTGDEQMDLCLAKIFDAKKQADAATWVGRFGADTEMKHRIAEGLCRRGILRAEKDKFLLIFTRRIYPELDPEPERELIARLEEAIFTDVDSVEARTAVLVSLANSAGMLKDVFNSKELRKRTARIKSIANGNVTCRATNEAIEAAQAAMTAAIISAAVVPTIVS